MLSVIITVYKQPQSAIALLHCLRVQDIDEPFEVLICDDGSSPDLLKTVALDDQLSELEIRYVWQCRRGPRISRSKNNAIRCSEGSLLVFIDGDIIVGPDFLRKHRDAHTRPQQIVCNPRRWLTTLQSFSPFSGAPERDMLPTSEYLNEIVKLAKEDVTSLIRRLEASALTNDIDGQLEFQTGRDKWMRFIGFSFSVDKSIEIKFDENFEGWGPEDRELALRLQTRYGYDISFRHDIIVYHLEHCSTGRDQFSRFPNTHEKIVRFLKNMCYLLRAYPEYDLSVLMFPLLSFRVDVGAGTWELRTSSEIKVNRPGELAEHICFIQDWLRKHE
jgi:glycosyltransferase involved in cell wall biosynthesis